MPMGKLNFTDLKKIWALLPEDEETKNYKPCNTDLAFLINGYLFIIQIDNGFNNIIFKKIYTVENITLKETLLAFRDVLVMYKIEYVRVEGTLRRYNFLLNIFEGLKDEKEKLRNVFYFKVY